VKARQYDQEDVAQMLSYRAIAVLTLFLHTILGVAHKPDKNLRKY